MPQGLVCSPDLPHTNRPELYLDISFIQCNVLSRFSVNHSGKPSKNILKLWLFFFGRGGGDALVLCFPTELLACLLGI